MRDRSFAGAAVALSCAVALSLAACATHERTRTAYVGTGSLDESQVTQLLNNDGYHDVTNLHKNGQDWVGSATKSGNPVDFDIDPTGTIHTR